MTSRPSLLLRRFLLIAAPVALIAAFASAEEPNPRPLLRSTPGTATRNSTNPPATATATTTPQAAPNASTPQTGSEQPVEEHPLKPAIRLAQESLDQLAEVRDYQASIARKELVGSELVVENMQMKFREEPFSVYLLFGGANAGREVIYFDGRNENKLLAHEGSGFKSFFGTISLAPDNPQVLKHSRHKITEIGLRNMLKSLVARWESESQYAECDVKYYHNAKISERPCLAIESSHPRPRKQFKFHITRLYIDKEHRIATRLENWGFPPQPGAKPVLIEEYTYGNLKTNVGFTDSDFDRTNPKYRF